MNEMVDLTLTEFEEDLNKSFNHLIDELMLIRVGRANPKIVENVKVDYYGAKTPLKQTSNIVVEDARMLVVSPWDPSTLKTIRAGLDAANLGVSLNDDGKDCLEVFRDLKKNSELSEDDLASLEKDVQKTLDNFTAKADSSCDKKIAEIMEV